MNEGVDFQSRFGGRRGAILLLACLVPMGQGLRADPPDNDAFADAEVLEGAEGQVTGSNRDATREAFEPRHALALGGASVWWKWTAPYTGGATFNLEGSGFDTVMGVYVGTSLRFLQEVAANNDHWDSLQSLTSFEITEGVVYYIAVDGFEEAEGRIVLQWSSVSGEACLAPPVPVVGSPADGSTVVGEEVTLSWNPLRRRAREGRKVLYGEDDRHDLFEIDDPALLAAWDSTVALVDREELQDNGDGTFSLPATPLREWAPFCSQEPYLDQPNPAWCSGFLVAPDLMATAGHCLPFEEDCEAVAFVFGFRMLDEATAVLTFDASEIYFCDGIVGGMEYFEGADWAVVRLDRPVENHAPLRIRRQGEIADDAPVVTIGHPSGLPAKITDNALVTDNSFATHFRCNLDAFGGNSGSAVFNAETMMVEGVLVRGVVDFYWEGDCLTTLRCNPMPDQICRGEDVTRTILFDQFIPALPGDVTYEVHFGEEGRLRLVGETPETSWQVTDLEPETRYEWKVVATNDCGTTEGPVWSFATPGADDVLFLRGDASGDGGVNLTDAIFILNHLFLAGPVPGCLDSADSDDNGVMNLTDAVYLLNYLFLAGQPLPEPTVCGLDESEDLLACDSFDPCS